MDDKKFSLDDILLEVGLSSAHKEEDIVDVDALLQNIVNEKQTVKQKEAPFIAEPPTKEFTPAKRSEPTAVHQAAPRKSMLANPAPEPQKVGAPQVPKSDGQSLSLETVSYTHLDVYKRQV